LAILAEAVRLVKIIHKVDIDIDTIDLNDKKTFEMLSRGETMGLFQLNGSGMTRYLKELKPSTIHDINAMVALYRPGPMEMIPEYIKRKHNPKAITYLDPRLKDILSMSYGIITYQDDVLMTAINLGGYSWLEADKLRKAMGKKIPEVMEAEREKLLAGLVKHGMSEKKAQEIWTLIEPFAAYGFGKAHAASYGLVAYQTAYMKANYPVEYMSAIMTSESGDIEKVAEIIHECEKMQIKVLPPNVNESYGGFTVIKGSDHATDRTIRFGFYNIKNLGVDIADSIIEERKKNGHFKSLADFLERINHKNLNKKSIEALAKCGAMDDMVTHRNMVMGNLEKLLAFNKETRGQGSQDSLFGSIGGIEVKLSLDEQIEATLQEKLTWEKDLLGLYVSGHPLDNYKDKIEKFGTLIKKVKEELKVNTPVTIAAIIDDIRIVTTKNNNRMAFIKISDYTGSVDAVIFNKLFETNKDILIKDTIIALTGKVTERNGEKSIMIDNFKKI
jgi:DNA polymerase-3 subunit alpha